MRNPPRWRAVARPALAGLAPAGLALLAVAMLPPVETLARRYLFVESLQFCLLSMAGPRAHRARRAVVPAALVTRAGQRAGRSA